MRFDLVRPCPHCPFRTDRGGYLTPERAREIGEAVALEGRTFTCHETTTAIEHDDGMEMVDGERAQHCAGALLFAEWSGSQPPQLARIAERLGEWEPGRLDRDAPVVSSLSELVELHGGEPVCEACSSEFAGGRLCSWCEEDADRCAGDNAAHG